MASPRGAFLLTLCSGTAALAVPPSAARLRAATSISEWHEAACQRLASDLNLLPDFNELQTGNVVAWVPERQSSRVACCTALSLDAGTEHWHHISVWNAPTVEVPHLFLRLDVAEEEKLHLEIDFRHRLAAGYERQQADGSFPCPESRDEFAQAGTRDAYDSAFFTEEAREWRESVCAIDGAQTEPASSSGAVVEGRRQFAENLQEEPCSGPLLISLSLPLTDTAVAAATAACEHAEARWREWMATAVDATWINNRRVYDRDCLVRTSVLRARTSTFVERLGEESGRALALADAGRQDMMGHNLMQEQGGFGSDPDEGRD
jgi:hypothetical protein